MDLTWLTDGTTAWGSVADWATALAAVIALVFARGAWRASQSQAESTQTMLVLEQQREDRADEREAERRRADERAAQADLVAAWVEAVGKAAVIRSQLVELPVINFLNSSTLPVYSVGVVLRRLNGEETFMPVGVLAPGKHSLPGPVLPPGTSREVVGPDGAMGTHQETFSDLAIELWFTDAAGRQWKREADGHLSRRETADAGDADAR